MKKYYLITGGNGYIGQNLYWRQWSNHGINCNFTICDKNTILPPAHKLKHEHLEGYDGVIHFAALSGIDACEKSPELACIDNIMSAGNVFSLATDLGIPVIFTSSQAAKNPHSSIYANTKWACEKLADYYNHCKGNIYVVRLANVYGSDNYLEKKNTCVKQFISRYRQKQPFIIHGNGEQKRDFVHVFDVCEAIYKIINKQPNYFSPIDIGTGNKISILDLKNMFPYHECEFIEERSSGVDSSVADISIIEKLIDYKPKRKLEDYIKCMI